MEAIKTSYANILLTGEGCLDLPAAVWPAEDRPGMLNFETAWKPSANELADLLAGGTLYINHLVPKGLGFPPVLPTTFSSVEDSREANWEGTRTGVRLASEHLAKALEALEAKKAGGWLDDIGEQLTPEEVEAFCFRITAILKALHSLEYPAIESSRLAWWLDAPWAMGREEQSRKGAEANE